MTSKILSDDELLVAAKNRVAYLFKINPNVITFDSVFGEDLKESFVSNWKLNEFDLLLEEIQSIAEKKVRKELGSGVTVIRTVGDYCNFMVHCYHVKPKEVIRILFNQPA